MCFDVQRLVNQVADIFVRGVAFKSHFHGFNEGAVLPASNPGTSKDRGKGKFLLFRVVRDNAPLCVIVIKCARKRYLECDSRSTLAKVE